MPSGRNVLAINVRRQLLRVLQLWFRICQWLTSREGRNRLSFSTTTTFLGPAFRTDRVRAPGPGPTSHTQQPSRWPANLTRRSGGKMCIVTNSQYNSCLAAVMIYLYSTAGDMPKRAHDDIILMMSSCALESRITYIPLTG